MRPSILRRSETCFGTRSQSQVLTRIHAIGHNLRTATTRCTAFLQKPTAIWPDAARWERPTHGGNQLNQPFSQTAVLPVKVATSFSLAGSGYPQYLCRRHGTSESEQIVRHRHRFFNPRYARITDCASYNPECYAAGNLGLCTWTQYRSGGLRFHVLTYLSALGEYIKPMMRVCLCN